VRGADFDISDKFIDQGRRLAAAAGIPVEFVRTSVYDIPASFDWNWLVAVVLPHEPCSGCQEDTLPQQVEIGSPIHLPFERFKPIDLAFGLTVAIRCF